MTKIRAVFTSAKPHIYGGFLGLILSSAIWIAFPGNVKAQENLGPGDGKGKQYWKCRWEIACDNSHEYSCSTGGSCNHW